MELKIVSWNVNGLSTIVHYHPWNISPTPFKALLEHLNADIICFQEHKLQRKDITYQMANIPGFDGYFSFSKIKKGYSGVAIYLRQHLVCLKAEEGLTGRLKSPSGIAYQDLPDSERIGGYPTSLSQSEALDLDSEGRAVIVELEWFVFISVYCPAVTTIDREVFRAKFLVVLEERIRNLLGLGKTVIVAGDINICRDPIDTADPVGAARRTESGVFEDTPSRRWFKQLLHPDGPLVDTGRHFHPSRQGMYTCWEQRIQARAGNYGARIDYILASENLLGRLTGADISANIIGSDHCPIWATLTVTSADNISGPRSVEEGIDVTKPSQRPPPRLCTRYLSDIVPSQSIKSLFTNIPGHIVLRSREKPRTESNPRRAPDSNSSSASKSQKREATESSPSSQKKRKVLNTGKPSFKDSAPGQRSLSDFMKRPIQSQTSNDTLSQLSAAPTNESETESTIASGVVAEEFPDEVNESGGPPDLLRSEASKQWNSIFTRKGPPLCIVHGLPCIELVTKKPGPNLGRRFWICSKPVGPGYDNGKSIVPCDLN